MTDPFEILKLTWLAKVTPDQVDHTSRLIDIDFYLFKYLKLKDLISGDERDIEYWNCHSYNQFHDYVKTIHKGH